MFMDEIKFISLSQKLTVTLSKLGEGGIQDTQVFTIDANPVIRVVCYQGL